MLHRSSVMPRRLVGAAAAAGIALINTLGNIAGFAAGYATGGLRSLSGSYTLPMFVVGGLMLMSGLLMFLLNRADHRLADLLGSRRAARNLDAARRLDPSAGRPTDGSRRLFHRGRNPAGGEVPGLRLREP